MQLTITAIYAGLLAIFGLFLSARRLVPGQGGRPDSVWRPREPGPGRARARGPELRRICPAAPDPDGVDRDQRRFGALAAFNRYAADVTRSSTYRFLPFSKFV